MSDNSFLADVLKAAAGSALITAAAWGAAGGATSALVIKVRLKDALRQIIIGALVAAGSGALGGAFLVRWVGLPREMIAVTGAASSVSYLTGVFGPAIFSLILQRLQTGEIDDQG
ncbi:hypothetical protein [Acidimangrovimonas pyrenivorans]|uniref:Holin n=1 Tax=Acidimangrovimonas pyrenivorans TaxID=2030798 RepID=A0ABV7ANW7_9RHOB